MAPVARAEIEADAKIITVQRLKQPLNTLGSPTKYLSSGSPPTGRKFSRRSTPRKASSGRLFGCLRFRLVSPTLWLASRDKYRPEGLRMPAPSPSTDTQFTKRAQKIRSVRNASIGLGTAVPLAYLFRGAYFLMDGRLR